VSAREVAASAIQRHGDDLVTLSHFIHAHPELGYVEFESSAAVATLAEEAGFHLERGVADLPTAFRATMGDGDLNIVFCADLTHCPTWATRVVTTSLPRRPSGPPSVSARSPTN